MSFPRKLVEASMIDGDTGIVSLVRDHRWLNGYNKWLAIMMRANHDCQFILTKAHALASIYYIIKYISKQEASLHSMLTIAAAVRKASGPLSRSNTDIGRNMVLKASNKIQSHREVGVPEAVSHLLGLPDHFTGSTFANVHTTKLLQHMRRIHPDGGDPMLTGSEQPNAMGDVEEQDDADIVAGGDQGFTLVPIFDDYAYRGQALERYCLYDYSSVFYKSNRDGGFSFTDNHPQTRSFRQFIRQPAIPTLLGQLLVINPRSDDQNVIEDYYCMLSGLFVPWADHRPFKPTTSSWKAFFESQSLPPRVLRYVENIDLLHRSQEEARINRLQMNAQESDNEYENFVRDEEIELEDDHDDDDGTDASRHITIEETFLRSSDTSDPYVLGAIDACLDYGFFEASSGQPSSSSSSSSSSWDGESGSIYYSSLPAKPLLDSINKPSASVAPPRPDPGPNTPIEPRVFLNDGTADRDKIDRIVREFNLNENQTIAFRIVADHSLGHGRFGRQLRMGVFGEGGTGKSRVIEAIRAWFTCIGRERELAITALTGVAAQNIDGATLHSSAGIPPQESGDDRSTPKISEKKAEEWKDRRYLIVDEVSMMSCKIINQLHVKLGLAKCNAEDIFGGVNLLFFGDMLQLPVVKNYPVYVRHPSWEKGHQLWRSLNSVVILDEQMRQAKDPVYADLLRRLRFHAPTKQDIELLQTRIGAPLPQSARVPVIVRRNSLRHAINDRMLHLMSHKTGTPITHCIATVVKKCGMSMDQVRRIKVGDDDNTLGDGILGLLPGAPLMITKNLNQELGIDPSLLPLFVIQPIAHFHLI